MFGSKAREARRMEKAWAQEAEVAMDRVAMNPEAWEPPSQTRIHTIHGYTYYVEESFDTIGERIQAIAAVRPPMDGWFIFTIAERHEGRRVAIPLGQISAVVDLSMSVAVAPDVVEAWTDPSVFHH